jgi:hypothetical protein
VGVRVKRERGSRHFGPVKALKAVILKERIYHEREKTYKDRTRQARYID